MTDSSKSGKIIFLTYKCQRCKCFMPRSEAFFDVNLEIISGNNQLITSDTNPQKLEEELHYILETIAQMDPQDLEDEVYFQKTFRLCPSCRVALIKWLNLK